MKLIYKIATVLMFTLITISTQAQTKDHIFGIKGGLNISNINGIDDDPLTGMHLGVFYEFPLSERFSVQSETMYSYYGSKSTSKFDIIKDVEIHALQIPILAKYYPFPYFGLEIGPQINLLLDGEGGVVPKDDYKIFDLGFSAGFTYSLSKMFEIGVRYNHGLSDITKSKIKHNTRVTQVSLGVRF